VAKTCTCWPQSSSRMGLILSNRFSPLAMLLLAIVMGVGMAGVGFNVAHDASTVGTHPIRA